MKESPEIQVISRYFVSISIWLKYLAVSKYFSEISASEPDQNFDLDFDWNFNWR